MHVDDNLISIECVDGKVITRASKRRQIQRRKCRLARWILGGEKAVLGKRGVGVRRAVVGAWGPLVFQSIFPS